MDLNEHQQRMLLEEERIDVSALRLTGTTPFSIDWRPAICHAAARP
jgi:hypothetical protein